MLGILECMMKPDTTVQVCRSPRTPLVEMRRECGLTREQLAVRAGVCLSTIDRIERGVGRPHPGTLRLVADALGVPPESLKIAIEAA